MYDQNRPEERPPGDEKPARRRLGRAWGPAEDAPEADESGQVGQGAGQGPEQYRFDPDRGRRHRYSEEPTGQVPNVPVEIAETGPTVPATRRSPGEQFEPIPQAPHPGQDSPFAPPGPNPEYGAAPGANHQQFSAPPNPGPAPGPPAQAMPHAPHQTPATPQAEPEPRPGPHAPQTGPLPVAETGQSAPPNPTPSPAVPDPVTEQHPPRTPPASRQPLSEPTPPVAPPVDDETPEGDEQLLEAVRQVPGVRDAYHVSAPDGSASLRLELEEGVDPDAVHAAVSAVVAERRATEPGPQTVDEPGEEAQAQIEPAAPAEAEVPDIGAVELRRVEIDSAGLDAEVAVTLAVGGRESAGSVTVPPIDWHVQHAAAAAAVEALRPYFGHEARIEVEHASIVPTGPVKTAVVVVLWMDGSAVRRLAGAAVVTAERSRAVVSATLSALAAEVAPLGA